MKRLVAFLLTVLASFAIIIGTVPGILDSVKLGLDLKGGFEILYEASPLEEGQAVTHDALVETARNLSTRAQVEGGVGEPEINPEGSNRIRVRLAGVENIEEVRARMKEPAVLTFRSNDGCSADSPLCKIELRGTDFVEGTARVDRDEMNRPIVSIELKDAQNFYDLTGRLSKLPFPNNVLAIMLDETIISQPSVNFAISGGKATITGSDSLEEAKQLASTINLGSLPLKLTEKYIQKVDATLGLASLDQTVQAAAIGSIIILIFMILYYRMPGIVATITLIIYTWLTLLIFNLMNATLTLPGIAAFVLGIGMAVDANIITYERIREELRSGKSVLSAVRSGSKSSFRTIMDANITTIIAAAVLFVVGTGAIKGFALILILSILVSILTNVFLSRVLLSMLVRSGLVNKLGLFGVKAANVKSIHAKQETTYQGRFDFVKHSRKFYTFSIIVFLIGVLSLSIFGINYGVDFKAGTSLDFTLPQTTSNEEVDQIIASTGLDQPPIRTVGGELNDRLTLRFDHVVSPDEITALTTAMEDKFGDGVSSEESTVDPVLALELRNLAIIAIGIASVFMVVYMMIRFEWRFAIAAIVSLLHDALLVISVFSVFQIEVNLPFLAAILTIIGYSINDTIVIFDRIRENLRFAKVKTHDDLKTVVNQSVNQTLSRSINTMLTVLIASLALLFLGSPSILLFSLAITIGLAFGGYSSIFIASPLWLLLKKTGTNKKQAVKS